MGANVWPVDAVSGAPSYTGRLLRQLVGLFWGRNPSRPLGANSGVVVGTPTSIASATSSTWTVTPFGGVIDGEASAVAGAYNFSFDSNQTGSVNAADATNPRVDLLYVRVSDPAEGDGSSVPLIELLYTAGTPAASPSAPATPARSMALATILVPKSGGGSPAVSFVANWAVSAGGVLPVGGGVRPSSPYAGQLISDASSGLWRYDGTAWRSYGTGIDTGWINAASLASGWSMDSTPLQFRQQGNVIRMKGGVINATFNSLTLTAACALPSGIALPLDTVIFDLPSNSGALNTTRLARILTDGTVQVSTNGTTSTAYRFDTKSYTAD